MWSFLRKRGEEDLGRLVSAYRCYLKAARQAEESGEGGEGPAAVPWKGGFGKACRLLFDEWPTPNESRRFGKKMAARLGKTPQADRAFLEAFNDYLGQKRLSPAELDEVIVRGREAFER
jgi:hypothetical protein